MFAPRESILKPPPPRSSEFIAKTLIAVLQYNQVSVEKEAPALESVVNNDLLSQPGWVTEAVWEWKQPGQAAHCLDFSDCLS